MPFLYSISNKITFKKRYKKIKYLPDTTRLYHWYPCLNGKQLTTSNYFIRLDPTISNSYYIVLDGSVMFVRDFEDLKTFYNLDSAKRYVIELLNKIT